MLVRNTQFSILVVEDEWLIAEMIAEALRNSGFHVIGPARRVKDALRFINEEQPDAALLDVSLGREFSFPIAHDLAARHVPFIFMSGYSELDFPEEFRDRPMLTKPATPSSVLTELQSLLLL